jgi:hypothetical protein
MLVGLVDLLTAPTKNRNIIGARRCDCCHIRAAHPLTKNPMSILRDESPNITCTHNKCPPRLWIDFCSFHSCDPHRKATLSTLTPNSIKFGGSSLQICLLTAATENSNIIRVHPCDCCHIRAAHPPMKNLMSILGDESPNITFTYSKCFTLLVD